ncbi:MAG: excisionase family DNA-binding protein [Myxococcota bacterium]|nr:excisionase family DNA-binding protein [Myxococcota bacterium]
MRLISPRYLSEALGVSESSLKRWVDSGKISAVRTEGGHRRIELAEALRFIRETGTPVVKPELLDMPEIASAREHGDRLYDHLIAGDALAVRGWLFARYLEGETVAQIADGPVRSAMHALGDLWRHDAQGVFVEHRATAVVLQAVAQLRSMLSETPASAPLALGCAPAGDPYLLPSQLAGMVVEEAGMRAVNLGPDTPVAALEHAVAQHRPKLVWLSITTTLAPARARAIVRWLGALPASITAVIGGQESATLGSLPTRVKRVTSMDELAEIARDLTRARGR